MIKPTYDMFIIAADEEYEIEKYKLAELTYALNKKYTIPGNIFLFRDKNAGAGVADVILRTDPTIGDFFSGSAIDAIRYFTSKWIEKYGEFLPAREH